MAEFLFLKSGLEYPAAETPEDIVPLARVKDQLTVYFDDDDELLKLQTMAAIRQVEQHLGVPLIQRRSLWQVPDFDLLADDEPIRFRGNETAAIIRVRFWRPDDRIQGSPGGEIGVSGLGRCSAGRRVEIFAGPEGWPARLVASPAWVESVDQSALARNEAVVSGIISTVRLLYNGVSTVHPNSVIRAILDPFRKSAQGIPTADLSERIPYIDLTGENR